MEILKLLGVPVFIGLGTVIGWYIKAAIERRRGAEEKLREQRADLYIKILEPYIRIFSDSGQKNQTSTLKSITSFEYKQTAFRLSLMGSDAVVQAWNRYAQFTYAQENAEEKDPMKLFRLFGEFMLEIRKSIGNEDTDLKAKDMLSWWIKDIDIVFPSESLSKVAKR